MGRLTTDFKDYLYERLQDPDAVVGYLNASLESGDPGTFLLALRYVADARGVANVAQQAGLNRESLYKMLSDLGNPRLSSLIALFEAFGLGIQLRRLNRGAAEQTKHSDQLRPMLALVGDERSYIPELDDEEHDNTCTREPEPAAA